MKSNGKHMATGQSVVDIMRQAHTETGHGGEKKTHKKISGKYANILRSLVSQYIPLQTGYSSRSCQTSVCE